MRPSSVHSFAPRLVLAVIPALFFALPLRAQLSVSDTVRLRTRHTDQASGTVAPQ